MVATQYLFWMRWEMGKSHCCSLVVGNFAFFQQDPFVCRVSLFSRFFAVVCFFLFRSCCNRNSNPIYGQGSLRLTYNGVEEVFYDAFDGYQAVFEFGNCWELRGETEGAGEEVTAEDEECTQGFSKLELVLETDWYARYENELYLYEIDGQKIEVVFAKQGRKTADAMSIQDSRYLPIF